MGLKTKDVLLIIGVGGLLVSSVLMPRLPATLVSLHKALKNADKRELGRILKRLQKQEVIFFRDDGENIQISITDKGKEKILAYKFEDLKIKNLKRDGYWRLVIFDIPEYLKDERDKFREKLLQLGLIRVQDSIFASAYRLKDEVDFLCHYLGISDFVTVIVTNKIERGEELIFKRDKFI